MSALTVESYDFVCDILRNQKANNSKSIERIFEIESLIDRYESEIYQFLIKLLGETTQAKPIEKINTMLEEIRLYEWISDSCERIGKLYKKSVENEYDLADFDKNIDKILKETNNLINIIRFNINNLKDYAIFTKTLEIEDKINSLYKKNKKKVVVDMKKNTTKETIAAGICVLDIIREMEHIADNTKNIIKLHNTQQT
jgi:phosphate:Na+ symporter